MAAFQDLNRQTMDVIVSYVLFFVIFELFPSNSDQGCREFAVLYEFSFSNKEQEIDAKVLRTLQTQ